MSSITDDTGKLIAVIGDEDTVTGFVLAGIGQKSVDGSNFLVVKGGKCRLFFLFFHLSLPFSLSLRFCLFWSQSMYSERT